MQWFNLNSLLTGPELISDTYLSLFLTQLQQEGYSIFVVNGCLPHCNGDAVLATRRVTQIEKPRLISDGIKPNAAADLSTGQRPRPEEAMDDEKRQMDLAIQMSLKSNTEAERRDMEAAIALSLQASAQHRQGPSTSSSSTSTSTSNQEPPETGRGVLTEEEMLDAALKMSLEAS